MSQPFKAPEVPLPRCSHCGAELPGVSLFNWQAGPWLILAVYCAECRKVLHMQAVPMLEQQELPRVQIPS